MESRGVGGRREGSGNVLGGSEPIQALFGPEGTTKHVPSRPWLTRFFNFDIALTSSLTSSSDVALFSDQQGLPDLGHLNPSQSDASNHSVPYQQRLQALEQTPPCRFAARYQHPSAPPRRKPELGLGHAEAFPRSLPYT